MHHIWYPTYSMLAFMIYILLFPVELDIISLLLITEMLTVDI